MCFCCWIEKFETCSLQIYWMLLLVVSIFIVYVGASPGLLWKISVFKAVFGSVECVVVTS